MSAMEEVKVSTRTKRGRSRTPSRSRRPYVRAKLYRGVKLQGIHSFKQSVTGTQINGFTADTITQGAGVLLKQCYFTLNDLPQVASFTALFDQYRIDKVQVDFIPTAQICLVPQAEVTAVAALDAPIVAGGASGGVYGTVIDYDDSAALANLSAYMQYSNFKMGQVGSLKIHRRTFKPHVATAAYAGAFTSYANMVNQWIDCASTTVQHYGLKFYADIQASSSTGGGGSAVAYPQTWRIMATYWVSFKNVR